MLTAEEIKNVSFKTTGIIMKGYDCSEVDGFVKKLPKPFLNLMTG